MPRKGIDGGPCSGPRDAGGPACRCCSSDNRPPPFPSTPGRCSAGGRGGFSSGFQASRPPRKRRSSRKTPRRTTPWVTITGPTVKTSREAATRREPGNEEEQEREHAQELAQTQESDERLVTLGKQRKHAGSHGDEEIARAHEEKPRIDPGSCSDGVLQRRNKEEQDEKKAHQLPKGTGKEDAAPCGHILRSVAVVQNGRQGVGRNAAGYGGRGGRGPSRNDAHARRARRWMRSTVLRAKGGSRFEETARAAERRPRRPRMPPVTAEAERTMLHRQAPADENVYIDKHGRLFEYGASGRSA